MRAVGVEALRLANKSGMHVLSQSDDSIFSGRGAAGHRSVTYWKEGPRRY